MSSSQFQGETRDAAGQSIEVTKGAEQARLCKACKKIFQTDLPGYQNGISKHKWREDPHHQTSENFKDAITHGCWICHRWFHTVLVNQRYSGQSGASVAAIWARWQEVDGQKQPHDDLGFGFSGYRGDPRSGSFFLFLDERYSSRDYRYLYNLTFCYTHDPVRHYTPQSGFTGSEECLVQAKRWIQTCTQSHRKCNSADKEDWYPTRLLDIGNQEDPSLRLVLKSEERFQGGYASLSHCWGKFQIARLLKCNLGALRKSIDPKTLSETFQEAINVTRFLGVRYIWIDSLCIVQDDDMDWMQESAQIKDVYSRALINLAASASTDGSGGLFRSRRPDLLPAFTTATSWPGKEHICVWNDTWSMEVRDAPLNQRGWVLQEQLLSPRILHFGESQVYWGCSEMDACEIFPNGRPHHVVYEWGKNRDSFAPHLRKSSPEELTDTDRHAELSYRWRSLVETYSLCHLSYEDDKLVAFSGIAKYYQFEGNNGYLAGLWRSDLLVQLLWAANHERHFISTEGPEKPRQYRAPSWSWAAVNGPVVYYVARRISEGLEVWMEILEASTTALYGGDLFMQLSGGYIVVKGVLSTTSTTLKRSGTQFALQQEEYPPTRDESRRAFNFGYMDVAHGIETVTGVYCLLVTANSDPTDPGVKWRGRYLLLKKACDQPQGYYERVGVLFSGGTPFRDTARGWKDSISSQPQDYLEGTPGNIVLV
ncbi:HET-domain-containing protein [Eremomyces bilateralis CBS 781.70]|uniref:HET-domain-containing protein n=1 Tax=Eremomyces bilateralis CBS 781.70 TaxID=1392243 RepID=A0A6G1G164_9PEZI|nr:HET-domain-containing protein [Eremomyces bilateralis CBS 781.70]KAF1811671.1 HET-domain-containing protein [Eremomyces bilateralis CBS 781.70]